MNNFNALLSHQGSLKHVNHAHRQCAPKPTGRCDDEGGLKEAMEKEHVSEVSSMSDDDLSVNIELLETKVACMGDMHEKVSKLLPTNKVSEELLHFCSMEQIDAAIKKQTEFMMERIKRYQEQQRAPSGQKRPR